MVQSAWAPHHYDTASNIQIFDNVLEKDDDIHPLPSNSDLVFTHPWGFAGQMEQYQKRICWLVHFLFFPEDPTRQGSFLLAVGEARKSQDSHILILIFLHWCQVIILCVHCHEPVCKLP